MNSFNNDLQYSLDLRRNEDFNKFYYDIWEVKLIEELDYRKNKQEQQEGKDKRIHLKNGKVILVEEKCRRKDYGDIFLETVSNTKTNKPGWIETCQSEYLMYFIEPKRKVYLLPVELLKLAYRHNIQEWSKQYKIYAVPNKGYYSKGIGIPPEVLYAAIKKEMKYSY